MLPCVRLLPICTRTLVRVTNTLAHSILLAPTCSRAFSVLNRPPNYDGHVPLTRIERARSLLARLLGFLWTRDVQVHFYKRPFHSLKYSDTIQYALLMTKLAQFAEQTISRFNPLCIQIWLWKFMIIESHQMTPSRERSGRIADKHCKLWRSNLSSDLNWKESSLLHEAMTHCRCTLTWR